MYASGPPHDEQTYPSMSACRPCSSTTSSWRITIFHVSLWWSFSWQPSGSRSPTITIVKLAFTYAVSSADGSWVGGGHHAPIGMFLSWPKRSW